VWVYAMSVFLMRVKRWVS